MKSAYLTVISIFGFLCACTAPMAQLEQKTTPEEPASAQPRERTAASVNIVPRDKWSNLAPVEQMLQDHSNGITGIVIHASDGRNTEGMDEKRRIRDSVQQTHMVDGIRERKFGDVAYHYFIGPSGTIYAGRNENKIGDTFTRYPLDGQLLICLLGDFRTEVERRRDDSTLNGDGQQPTAAAKKALVKLIQNKMAEHQLALTTVKTHRQAAPNQTTCPGNYFQTWFDTEGRREIAE